MTELGYKVVSIEQYGEEIVSLSSKEVTFLAQKEHESWYKDMVNLGWKYGRRKSLKKHVNPNLLEWDKLNNKVKRLNIRTLEHLPVLCNGVGLKIIKDK
ncbi:RyR domain-containing protein [Methanobrevibacter sp.]|uniref:RyR domain-containing protein n=1 Tax=Methanobrevibacter sp. TaxID=66852 RepID=UPI00389057DE